MVYFSTRLSEKTPSENLFSNYVAGAIILLLSCYFIFLEILQAGLITGNRDESKYNLIDLVNVV